MKILHLTLEKYWFNLIADGVKVLEYREAKPHWKSRLQYSDGRFKQFDEIHFRNGYGKDKPFMRIQFMGCLITHSSLCVPKHGEILTDGTVFVIGLGRIIEIRLNGDE